jgi:hypothetical protein
MRSRFSVPNVTGPAPYPSDGMICWPVGPRVGNVKKMILR